MSFDALNFDDTFESFKQAAKRILRKNASSDEEKRIQRECDLLNHYNELILTKNKVHETKNKHLIAAVEKRTWEAREKLEECSEELIQEINVPY